METRIALSCQNGERLGHLYDEIGALIGQKASKGIITKSEEGSPRFTPVFPHRIGALFGRTHEKFPPQLIKPPCGQGLKYRDRNGIAFFKRGERLTLEVLNEVATCKGAGRSCFPLAKVIFHGKIRVLWDSERLVNGLSCSLIHIATSPILLPNRSSIYRITPRGSSTLSPCTVQGTSVFGFTELRHRDSKRYSVGYSCGLDTVPPIEVLSRIVLLLHLLQPRIVCTKKLPSVFISIVLISIHVPKICVRRKLLY